MIYVKTSILMFPLGVCKVSHLTFRPLIHLEMFNITSRVAIAAIRVDFEVLRQVK